MISGKITTKAMCIVVRSGKDILVTLGNDPVKKEIFGRLIGGGVEFGETALKCLEREFMEELGTKLENIVFLRVVENIFTYNGTHGHQITFLYKADFADKEVYEKDDMVVLDKPHVKVKWISLDDVKSGKMKLYPALDYEELLRNKER